MAEKELESPDPGIEEEEYNAVTESYKSGGTEGMRQYILTRLNRWKSTKINIAVTGNAGVGKSSLINALRNLKNGERGAAEVGSTQTTMELTSFKFPKNENVVLWDLPGVGTKDFPRETYKELTKLDRYDAYIIVTADRFTEHDDWLITNAISKHYYMVRTKMDLAVAAERRDNKLTELQTLQKVREDCSSRIGRVEHVYLISTQERHLYDFDKLCAALAATVNRSKHDALLFTLSNLGNALIEKKREEFKRRITIVAIGSAVAGFIPIPLFETLTDAAILLGEIRFYMEQFELNEESLISLSEELDKPLSEIKGLLETPNLDTSFKGLARYFQVKDKSSTFEKLAKYLIPPFGSFISSRKSFVACENCLNTLLEKTSEDAKKVVQMRMKQLAK